MGIEQLTEWEKIVGIGDTIFVIVSLIIGIKMLLKYLKLQEKALLTAALTWIFLSGVWWGGMLSFILFILFSEPLNQTLYLLFNNVFAPLALMCWIFTLSLLLYKKIRKILLAIFFIICIIYEILIITFIFTVPDIVGTFSGNYILTAQPFALAFQLFAVVITLITGIHFAMESLKSDKSKIRYKGYFLLLAFISFFIGILESLYMGFIEEVSLFTLIMIIIFKFFLISSGIEYYFGFFFPEKLVKRFIKKEI